VIYGAHEQVGKAGKGLAQVDPCTLMAETPPVLIPLSEPLPQKYPVLGPGVLVGMVNGPVGAVPVVMNPKPTVLSSSVALQEVPLIVRYERNA